MSETNDDFDLDMDSDEVADLVSFSNPADGVHLYGVVFAGMDRMGKDEDSPKCVRLVYQKVATVERVNEGDLDAKVGSVFNEAFGGSDMGQKLLKQRLGQIFGESFKGKFRPFVDALQEKKMSETLLQFTTKIIPSKDGKYENVRIMGCDVVELPELPQGFEQFEYTPAE